MDETIRLIITGGTFDKDYDPLSGKLTFRDTHLGHILEELRLTVPVVLEINQLTDSLEMSDEQRLGVVEACERAPETRIIITHGTDTMTETARLIDSRNLGTTIVLTGAMVPYSVSGSDAVFNLGTAVSAVQLLSPGVYVCMNGRSFPASRVRKDTVRGVFEAG